MPPKKTSHPEAEALFSGRDVPSLSDQAQNDRETVAQAGRDNRQAEIPTARQGSS